MDRFRTSAATHCGTVRDHNEDSYVSRPGLGIWAVADGAGGHEAGEVASAMIAGALDSIPAELTAEETLTQVRLRIAAVHTALRAEAERRGGDDVTLASTVVILIARRGHFACLWAGDARGYLLRNDAFTQITRDHSLVQELVDGGHITDVEAAKHPHANVVTRAVGAGNELLELDKVTDRLSVGDRFLLCSDGLCKDLTEGEIGEIMRGAEPEACAAVLVEAAIDRRARDNVTAVVLEVVADGIC